MGCGAHFYRANVGAVEGEDSEQQQLRPADQAFLEFYRGIGRAAGGFTLHEIWSWDHRTLELRHDYIQWLFPTDQPSKFSHESPGFPPQLQEVFKNDPQIMANVARSFDLFSNFLGLCYNEESGCVERGPDFSSKAQNWLAASVMSPNHNWLRCSRVLHCLRLLGDTKRRDAFYNALEQIYVDGLICSRFEETVRYWQQYGGIECRPIPSQENILSPISTKSSTASKRSPKLFRGSPTSSRSKSPKSQQSQGFGLPTDA